MNPIDGDSIVISGMSVMLPKCESVTDFAEKLYGKVNLVSDEEPRWDIQHPETSKHHGFINNLENFDASFFMMYQDLAQTMESATKKLLEHSFSTLMDASVSPSQVNGKKIGVFVAACGNESEDLGHRALFYNSVLGSYKVMMANRVSYCLNLRGPSVIIESGTSGSITALQRAQASIMSGECDAAFVGSCKVMMHPYTPIHYSRVVPLNSDGKTKSYDENADGQSLSEGVCMIYLQRYKDCKRAYARLCHAKSEFNESDEKVGPTSVGPYRKVEDLCKFLKGFYEEIKISPSFVDHVEGYGAAIPEVDKAELMAFEDIFCKNRKNPLTVGSVMSNVGYIDGVAPLISIVKLILANQTGEIAANINCDNPRRDIQALQDGRMQILNNHHHPFKRTLTAVNGISITGLNGHVLLEGSFKPKNLAQYNCNIPRLLLVSGRLESSVNKILEDVKSHPLDFEDIALLNEFHKIRIMQHLGRGFGIFEKDEEGKTVSLSEKEAYFDEPNRPLWFVYSGMGSQWVGMGKQLMRIPIFAEAIKRCHKALEPKGVNLIDVITSDNETTFDNILNCFIGIAAIQIGLTEVLKALSLVPDRIIGHSAGEMGCAYADGCTSLEETMLISYYRGLVSVETEFVKGSMAAVGIGYAKLSKIVPPEIDIACHNGPDSCTISGPEDAMRKFIEELVARDIFAKEVPCSNIPYHSRYIAKAGPKFTSYLNQVCGTPKKRSEKWLSTSIPQDKWKDPIAEYCAPEYHTNNLLNPVLFDEVLRLVPKKAVLVEIAPHGLLQAILKRSVSKSCDHIPLTRRFHKDNVLFLLEAIGKLYMEGFDVEANALYPKVEYPVSTSTRSLSHLIEWNYNNKMSISSFISIKRNVEAVYKPIITVYDDEYLYLKEHIIQDKNVFPFSGALVLVWETLAMFMGRTKDDTSVQFTDVTFYEQPELLNDAALHLTVSVQRSGWFEVIHDENMIMDGYITSDVKFNNENPIEDETTESLELTSSDVYKLLYERGYQYKGGFRSIHQASSSIDEAVVHWNDNWVTFIDGVLQLYILKQNTSGLSQFKNIKHIKIDTSNHQNIVNENNKTIKAKFDEVLDVMRCGGLQMEYVFFKNHNLSNSQTFVLNQPVFSLVFDEENQNIEIEDKCNSSNVNGCIALESRHIGDLNSLYWVKVPNSDNSDKLLIPVKVNYAGLSVYDAKKAKAEVSVDERCSEGFAMDFSGVTDRGDRVMGLVNNGAARERLLARPDLLWPVPEHWNLEEAASVPMPYAFAFYCLAIKANLKEGMKIFVHGGAGALGQAVISTALAHDCEVFTTASDVSKRQFLRKLFPELPATHIGNSRDETFKDLVLNTTKGRGCDIVISCASDENLKRDTGYCAGMDGITMDITQIQSQQKYNYGMYGMTKSRTYSIIDFMTIFDKKHHSETKTIQLLISDGISKGYVRPLSRVTYAPQDITKAFKLLDDSRHRGRVLINLVDFEIPAENRFICSQQSITMITHDDELFAAQLIDRLAKNGARNFFLHSSSKSGYFNSKMRSWKEKGLTIKTLPSAKLPFSSLLDEARSQGSIESIFVINTENVDNIATSDLTELDLSSRSKCPKLRSFVVISNKNDRGYDVCVDRFRKGLPSLFVQLDGIEKFAHEDAKEDGGGVVLKWLTVLDAIEKGICCKKPSFLISVSKKEINELEKNKKVHTDPEADVSEFNPLNKGDKEVSSYNILKYDTKTAFEDIREYFNFLDGDEIIANLDMTVMPTLIHNSEMRKDEFNVKEPFLCIVPGLEGHFSKLKKLCGRLKIATVMLQPGFERSGETPREMALRFVETMIKKLKLQKYFYILGYEYGTLVAAEMASILKERGFDGTLYFLGGTPEEICSTMKTHFGNMEPEALQNNLILYVFNGITGCDVEDLLAAIKDEVWDTKIQICINKLRSYTTISMEYIEDALKTVYNRIMTLKSYISPVVKSKTVVIKANNLASVDQSSKMVVEIVNENLRNILDDLRCSAIVNRHLGTALDVYKATNHCQSYVIDKNTVRLDKP